MSRPFTQREAELLRLLTSAAIANPTPFVDEILGTGPRQPGAAAALIDEIRQLDELIYHHSQTLALENYLLCTTMEDWDTEKPRAPHRVQVRHTAGDGNRLELFVWPGSGPLQKAMTGLYVQVEINYGVPALHVAAGQEMDWQLHLHARDGRLELHSDGPGAFCTLDPGQGVYGAAGLYVK